MDKQSGVSPEWIWHNKDDRERDDLSLPIQTGNISVVSIRFLIHRMLPKQTMLMQTTFGTMLLDKHVHNVEIRGEMTRNC